MSFVKETSKINNLVTNPIKFSKNEVHIGNEFRETDILYLEDGRCDLCFLIIQTTH
jgi:hypothetical protein